MGNPNAGKTTLFNALSGARQKIANYPGVTVEEVSSEADIDGTKVNFIDVPGLYSLEPVSEDEAVAAAVIHRENVDLLVCIIDGSNLERNLYIFTQIAALGKPVLVAVTMMDRMDKAGKKVDLQLLSERLHVPVVGLSGPLPGELKNLRTRIVEALKTRPIPKPVIERRTALAALQDRLLRMGYDFTLEQLDEKVHSGEQEFESFFADFPELKQVYDDAVAGTVNPIEPSARYHWTQQVQNEVISTVSKPKRKYRLTDRIDYVLTHRVWGLIVFVLIMVFVFECIYTFSGPLMDGIEAAFGWVGEKAGEHLPADSLLQSFIVDGVIAGVGGVVVFLPQILILFLLTSILEGTGYLARAAFLMDRLLGWCGLNGRAFIPLLSSFACAIPGIMAARVMPDPKSRLATILVAPLMSCSARLPVYLILIGAFIEPKFGPIWAGFALFAMHMLGFGVAIPVVYLLNRKMLKGKRLPFLLELPPYQWPRMKDVLIAMFTRGKVFLTTAGTTILAMSIIIWAAGYFPRSTAPAGMDEKQAAMHQLENSYLGKFGTAIQPVFAPLGFDWRISTAIVSAFPAREVVVPSLGILFALGEDAADDESTLRDTMREAKRENGAPLFTPWTAVGLMVFFALCAQCMSTLATVKRETNSRKWAWFMFGYMTALAYIGALIVKLLGDLFGG